VKRNPRNFIYLTVSDVVSHFLGFLATIYIARVLGAAGFGKISYALAFLNYALLFGNLGLTTIATREIARDRNNIVMVGDITGLRLILAGAIFIVILICGLVLPGEPNIKMLVVLYGLCVFPFAIHLEFVFQGREEMGVLSLGRIIQFFNPIVPIHLFTVMGHESSSCVFRLRSQRVLGAFKSKSGHACRPKIPGVCGPGAHPPTCR